MEKQLTKDVKETIEILDEKFSNDELFKKFQASSIEFDLMVKKGLTKKRGNHSFSVLDRGLTSVCFNT